MSATHTGRAWSCDVRLVVEDDSVLTAATADLTALLAQIDGAASRFRSDSALSRANAHAGRPVAVPKTLVELVAAALDAARRTDGAVDPTLGLAMQRAGYDRDFASLPADGPAASAGAPVVDWRSVELRRASGLLTVPLGCELDLGATAKAWAADRAARVLAARYGTGVMVELGGDVAVAGQRDGGWVIRVAERAGGPAQLVTIRRGGITTSTTTVRTWTRGGEARHHILDPITGTSVDGPWRTVSVATESALMANTATTAAIVKGAAALDWLTAQGLPARLVARDGSVVTTAGWPADPGFSARAAGSHAAAGSGATGAGSAPAGAGSAPAEAGLRAAATGVGAASAGVGAGVGAASAGVDQVFRSGGRSRLRAASRPGEKLIGIDGRATFGPASTSLSPDVHHVTVHRATVRAETVRSATVGSVTVRSETVRSATVGSAAVRAETVRTATVGSATVRSETVRTETVRAETVEPAVRQPGAVRQRVACVTARPEIVEPSARRSGNVHQSTVRSSAAEPSVFGRRP